MNLATRRPILPSRTDPRKTTVFKLLSPIAIHAAVACVPGIPFNRCINSDWLAWNSLTKLSNHSGGWLWLSGGWLWLSLTLLAGVLQDASSTWTWTWTSCTEDEVLFWLCLALSAGALDASRTSWREDDEALFFGADAAETGMDEVLMLITESRASKYIHFFAIGRRMCFLYVLRRFLHFLSQSEVV